MRCSWAGSGDVPAELVRAELGRAAPAGPAGCRRVSAMSRSSDLLGAARHPGARRAGPRAASGPSPASTSSGMPSGRNGVAAPSRAANTMTHPVRPEPAGAEQQRVGGGGVEPVRVVDDAQHDALLGRRGQHRQRRDRHQERLDRGPVLLAERDPQRPGLGAGRSLAQPHHRDAAAGAAPRTPTAPRPRGPGCAAPVASPACCDELARAAPTCRRPARRAPPGCRRTRAAPARPARPGARSRLAADQHASTVLPPRAAGRRSRNPALWPGRGTPMAATLRTRRTTSHPGDPGSTATTPGGTTCRHVQPRGVRTPRSATSGCCSSTASRSSTPSGPGRCSPTGRSSTPRTAGAISCLSADGADVIGAKNLVLGAHHSLADAPALDVLIHPGGQRHPAAAARPRPPRLGARPARRRPADGLGVHRQPRLRGRRAADRSAGDHALGVAEPALRARPHRRSPTSTRGSSTTATSSPAPGSAPASTWPCTWWPASPASNAPARSAAASSTTRTRRCSPCRGAAGSVT